MPLVETDGRWPFLSMFAVRVVCVCTGIGEAAFVDVMSKKMALQDQRDVRPNTRVNGKHWMGLLTYRHDK